MRHSPNETEPSANTPGHYEIPQDLDVYPGAGPIKIYLASGAKLKSVGKKTAPSDERLKRYEIPPVNRVPKNMLFLAPEFKPRWVKGPAEPEEQIPPAA